MDSAESFGTTLLSDYQPLFDGVFPANAYSTWFSAGIESEWLSDWSVSTGMQYVGGAGQGRWLRVPARLR